MIPILSVQEVIKAEQNAARNGLCEDILIENAASHIAWAVKNVTQSTVMVARKRRKARVTVAVGCGNNGADGLSAARLLHLAGYDVTVVCAAQYYGESAKKRHDAANYLGIRIEPFGGELPQSDVFVDALVGTGLNKPLSDGYKRLVEVANTDTSYKIAVDIPSGLCADTGEILGAAVKADETVTFSACKPGHFLNGAREYTGKLTICDIGVLPSRSPNVFLLEDGDFLLARRKYASHKYDYGVVKIVAGSAAMPGAAALARSAALAALKGGAGLCELCCPESLKGAFIRNPAECTYRFLPDSGGILAYDEPSLGQVLEKASVILIGPGMARGVELPRIIRYVAQNFTGTVVLDADALYALAQNPDCIKDKACKLIVTPHAGEFERLMPKTADSDASVIGRALELAARLDACVLYKSDLHIIAHDGKAYLNAALVPALAKGGSGDVLAGLVTAFAARCKTADSFGGDLAAAAVRASLCYGRAAKTALLETGEEGLLSSELTRYISR